MIVCISIHIGNRRNIMGCHLMDEQWDINMRSGIEEELWIFPSMRFAMRIFQRSKTQLMRWKTHLSSVQTSMVNLEHLFVAVS